MKIKKHLIRLDENIDVILAKLGIILGIVGAVLSALNQKGLIILGLSTSFICFSYLYIKRKKPEKITTTSNRIFYILIIAFFLLLSLSLLILCFSEPYTIPISFYIIISASYAIIAAEIFFINKESKIKYLPLLQILIVSLFFRLVLYFQFPSILGVDPWSNYEMFNTIISKGYFSSGYMYSNFPIFPSGNVISLLITGLGYKHCLFFTMGIVEFSSIVFVFLLGKSICNFKTGILASLFISFYPAHIAFGTYSILPMSIGITFFSIIFYLIIKNHVEKSLKINIIIIFLLLTMILVHTIASAICFLVLLSSLIGKYLYKFLENKHTSRGTVTAAIVSFFGVALVGYWMWASSFMGYIAESIKFAFQVAQSEYGPPPVYLERINFYDSLFGNLEYLIITLLLFYGSLVWLNKKNRTLTRYYLLFFVGITCSIIYITGETGYDAMLPDRWLPFIYLLLSIFICFGLIKISAKLKISSKIIITSVIFILIFIMIISNPANVDAPLYDSTSRLAFVESEMISAGFIYYKSNETIYTDEYQSVYFHYILKKNTNTYDISYFRNDTNDLIVASMIRDYTLKKYFFIPKGKKQVGYLSTLIEGKKFNMQIFDEANRIYDCKSVCFYK